MTTANHIVVDSSAIISLVNRDDANHARAVQIAQRLAEGQRLLLVVGDVFTECVNVLGKKLERPVASRLAHDILTSGVFAFIEPTFAHELRTLALQKFGAQPRSVSYTDCLVMALADQMDTKEVFGFDEAFKKNGYIRLGVDDQAETEESAA